MMSVGKWGTLLLGLSLLAGPIQAADVQARNSSVREILTGLARLTGDNIIIADDVRGNVTLTLHDVTPQEALQLVAEAADVTLVKNGRTWLVHGTQTNEKAAKQAHSFALNYADPVNVQKELTAIVPAEQVQINPESASVIVYGTPRELAEVDQLLKKIDYAYRQVNVSVEVVAVNRDHIKELGIDWDWLPLTGSARYETRYERGRGAREKVEEIVTPDGFGSIQFGKTVAGHPYSFFFRAKLNALVADGNAQILARPNITTVNGKTARILIGNKIPVLVDQITNGEKVTTTEYRDAGIRLLYTPRVNAAGEITADVTAEVSTPYLVPERRAYRITTREAQTTVRLQPGEALTIGGLIDREEQTSERRVPILSEIPILGRLFRTTEHTKNNAEIMITITADLLPERPPQP